MISEEEIKNEIFKGNWEYDIKTDVELSISHKQYSQDLEPKGESFVRTETLEDDMEVITEAFFYKNNNEMYFIYDESETTELKDCTTVLIMSGGVVHMNRYAKDVLGTVDMEFREGKRHVTRYHTPMGGINLELLTNKVEYEVDDQGIGNLYLDYNIKLEGLMSRRNKLNIVSSKTKGREE